MSLIHMARQQAVLRHFVKDPEKVAGEAEKVADAARRLISLETGEKRVYTEVNIIVAGDKNFVDHDCGQSFDAVNDLVAGLKSEGVIVSNFTHGDPFVELLNWAAADGLSRRMSHTTYLSTGVVSYATIETEIDKIEAHERGAKAVGVKIGELSDSIGDGRLANTFASYLTKEMLAAGGFCPDSRNARVDNRLTRFIQGEKGAFYPLHGVEEIALIVALIKKYGKCIAPINPRGDGVKVWVAPDPATDPEGYKRHTAKLETKFTRQLFYAMEAGVDFGFIRDGVMDEFRTA